MSIEWKNIVLNPQIISGTCDYCIVNDVVTISLSHLVVPDIQKLTAFVMGNLPDEAIPSHEVREVTLLSDGQNANIILTKEGYIIFQAYQDVPALSNFSAYKSYLVE